MNIPATLMIINKRRAGKLKNYMINEGEKITKFTVVKSKAEPLKDGYGCI